MTQRLPLTVLNQVKVRRPCMQSWDAMTGDDERRYCDECGLHVHNLSAMPREKAEALVAGASGRLCVRYAQNEQGSVLTHGARPRGRWLARACALLSATMGMLLGGCERGNSVGGSDSILDRFLLRPSSRPMMQGDMCPIPSARPAPPAPIAPPLPVAPPPAAD